MSIEKHNFSDPNFDGSEVSGDDLWVYFSTHSDLDRPTSFIFDKVDAIALAKHFKLTSDDLL